MPDAPEPRPLDYARPREPDPSRPRHPAIIAWLLLFCVIAFFSVGLMGLVYIDVLGASAAGVVIASGVFMAIAIFGFLSRPQPQFVAAAIMTLGGFAAAAFATLLTNAVLEQLRTRILSRPGVSGSVTIYAQSDIGKDLSAISLARTMCAAATGLAFCLMVYLVVQCFVRPRGISCRE